MTLEGIRRLAIGLIVLSAVGEAMGVSQAVITNDYSKLAALTVLFGAGAGLGWYAGFGMK